VKRQGTHRSSSSHVQAYEEANATTVDSGQDAGEISDEFSVEVVQIFLNLCSCFCMQGTYDSEGEWEVSNGDFTNHARTSAATIVSVPCFISQWNENKSLKQQKLSWIKMKLQYLKHNKTQFLDLNTSTEMRKCKHPLKLEAELQTFKTLQFLEAVLLMQCDVDWLPPEAAAGDSDIDKT
jgi:hypothetical protein